MFHSLSLSQPRHTFIICCGNKCSFIDYKIKVSVVRQCVCVFERFFFLCGVSLSNDYSTVARDVVNHGYGLNLYTYHMYIFARWHSVFFSVGGSAELTSLSHRFHVIDSKSAPHTLCSVYKNVRTLNRVSTASESAECLRCAFLVQPLVEMNFMRLTAAVAATAIGVSVCWCMCFVCNPYRLQFPKQ